MSVLYTPKGRAREYAPLAVNLYSGCSHSCRYCYVPTIPPWKFSKTARHDFHTTPKPRNNVLAQLKKDCESRPGHGERVMLCFTTDPYQPINDEFNLTRGAIQTLHQFGYNVQILTKGGRRALKDIDLFSSGDAFATTMTLLSDEHSRKWEPGAALPQERIDTIRQFYDAGVSTWISLEPVLNPESALEIIRITSGFTHLYKIGKLNHHSLADRFDWSDFGLRAIRLCESLKQPYYIKDDLALHLPSGALGPHHITVEELERHISVLAPCQYIDEPHAHRQLPLFQSQ